MSESLVAALMILCFANGVFAGMAYQLAIQKDSDKDGKS